MKKILSIIFILSMLYSVIFSLNLPQEIVSKDSYGNNIYQVNVGNIKLGFKVIGEGEPVILLMGLGGTFENWPDDLINILSNHFQLILLDNRGMGWSTDIEEPFSYEILSEDVIRFMDKIELENANMIGYSMGSIFIQYIMLNHNEKINKAILIATSINTEGVLDSLYENANAPLPSDGPVKKQMDIVDDWSVNPEKFRNVENKILLVHGDSDNILFVENSLILSEYLPNSFLEIFEEGDHYLMFRYSEIFSNICLEFLMDIK